jgi:hypothetical protein
LYQDDWRSGRNDDFKAPFSFIRITADLSAWANEFALTRRLSDDSLPILVSKLQLLLSD